jgi:hypothetical protein
LPLHEPPVKPEKQRRTHAATGDNFMLRSIFCPRLQQTPLPHCTKRLELHPFCAYPRFQ